MYLDCNPTIMYSTTGNAKATGKEVNLYMIAVFTLLQTWVIA